MVSATILALTQWSSYQQHSHTNSFVFNLQKQRYTPIPHTIYIPGMAKL